MPLPSLPPITLSGIQTEFPSPPGLLLGGLVAAAVKADQQLSPVRSIIESPATMNQPVSMLQFLGKTASTTTRVNYYWTLVGTWADIIIPANAITMSLVAVGGGGGSGGARAVSETTELDGVFAASGGGGGGAIAAKYEIDAVPYRGQTVSVTVGAGGAGGLAASNFGNAGGESYVIINGVPVVRSTGGQGGFSTRNTNNTTLQPSPNHGAGGASGTATVFESTYSKPISRNPGGSSFFDTIDPSAYSSGGGGGVSISTGVGASATAEPANAPGGSGATVGIGFLTTATFSQGGSGSYAGIAVTTGTTPSFFGSGAGGVGVSISAGQVNTKQSSGQSGRGGYVEISILLE